MKLTPNLVNANLIDLLPAEQKNENLKNVVVSYCFENCQYIFVIPSLCTEIVFELVIPAIQSLLNGNQLAIIDLFNNDYCGQFCQVDRYTIIEFFSSESFELYEAYQYGFNQD